MQQPLIGNAVRVVLLLSSLSIAAVADDRNRDTASSSSSSPASSSDSSDTQSLDSAPQVSPGSNADLSGRDGNMPEIPVVSATAIDTDPMSNQQIADLVERVRPSVVVIRSGTGNQTGIGTGFVVSADGLIATNLHVIGEGRSLSVQTATGKSWDVTEVHAFDRTLDLAIIRVAARDLTPLEPANFETLRQGEQVIAIGNPLGLTHSVVSGIVSSRREMIEGQPMIQLAMPIELGNSGGPVIDMQGRVQGVVTLRYRLRNSIGFAVAADQLKPLLAKPNPISMARWLKIGELDSQRWQALFGANWRQRAARVLVDGQGPGIGKRSMCLYQPPLPDPPLQISVRVRLDDESGAAGLVFHSDGDERHYGFYPSNGRMRLSRFDGPTVYTWHVLDEVDSDWYQPGDWNVLRVEIEPKRIRCFVNEHPVIESDDARYSTGHIGLAQFRGTKAEFEDFRVASFNAETDGTRETLDQLVLAGTRRFSTSPESRELVDRLTADGGVSSDTLLKRASNLTEQAETLRHLARRVNARRVAQELSRTLNTDPAAVNLLRAALLVAKHDDESVDVALFEREVDRIAEELRTRLKDETDSGRKLAALNTHLFEQNGFRGNRADYYNRANSYLNDVIVNRQGLPISLSVLYMEVAARVGLTMVGVGLPGHFVVRFEPGDNRPSKLIDVFNQGRELTRDEAVAEAGNATGQPFEERFLAAQSPAEIIDRMFRNLIGNAESQQDVERLLRYLDTQVTLIPKSIEYRAKRVDINYRTRRFEDALADVTWFLEQRPDGVDIDRLEEFRDVLQRELDKDRGRQ